MPKHAFGFEPGGSHRLELTWTGWWKNIQILHDGVVVADVAGERALYAGVNVRLADESEVFVRLHHTGLGQEVRVSRNGVPLPGSAADPESRIKAAAAALSLIGGANAVLGIAALALKVQVLLGMGFGWASATEGAVYALCAWFTARRSMVALVIGLILFSADTVGAIMATTPENAENVGPYFVRIVLFVMLVRAVPAMRRLRAEPAKDAHVSPAT